MLQVQDQPLTFSNMPLVSPHSLNDQHIQLVIPPHHLYMQTITPACCIFFLFVLTQMEAGPFSMQKKMKTCYSNENEIV